MASFSNKDAVFMKLKSTTKRKLLIWFIALIGFSILIFYGARLLSSYVEDRIHTKIILANGKASSVIVSLFERSVQVSNLTLTSVSDSINSPPNFFRLKSVFIKGISFSELLFHKNFVANEVVLDSGTIQYNKNIKRNNLRTLDFKNRTMAFKHIFVHHVEIEIKADTIVHFSALLNFQLRDVLFQVDSINNFHHSIKAVDVVAEHVQISRHEGMYGGSISRFQYDSRIEKLTIDSALLIPNFDKFDFAHQQGEQIGRLNISIPRLIVEGLALEEMLDSAFVVSRIEIKSFELFSFKDKRVPFLRKNNVPLPMDPFLKLPFKVDVDSIIISHGLITIEEFPEGGIEAGTITFDEVNATCEGLNNRIEETDQPYAVLDASALLMGTGQIKASFQFPLDGSLIYRARGFMSALPFAQLNPITENMASIRFESGTLNKLSFNFKYTDFTSKGELLIDYEDLRIASLNKNLSTNEFKTFIINGFVKNDKNRKLSKLQSTGIIDIERDRKRYIFNVWLKSLLAGLKSSVMETKKQKLDSKK